MLITLTTDFGLDDPFVAMMKGVILGRCPAARLVDICHTIPPQDITTASSVLAEAAPYFPGATIHVAVVDPGVGTWRRIICLEASSQLFLAPDNGLLTPFFHIANRAFQLTNDELFLPHVSATFHGRDIFAPVAAALAGGLAPQKLGPSIKLSDLIHLELPQASMNDQHLQGQCMRADHFGNMATNIRNKDLQLFLGAANIPEISIGDITIIGLSHTYGSKLDEPMALINSSDHLEISINGGNAAATFKLRTGTTVVVRKKATC